MQSYMGCYNRNHWALHPPCGIVHTKEKDGMIVYTYLHESDSRCGRLVVNAVPVNDGEPDFGASLDLRVESDEFIKLMNACFEQATWIMQKMALLGVMTQIMFTADECMSKTEGGTIRLGWDEFERERNEAIDPFFPHVHVVFRADANVWPFRVYFGGPDIGKQLDMVEGKRPWKDPILKVALMNDMRRFFDDPDKYHEFKLHFSVADSLTKARQNNKTAWSIPFGMERGSDQVMKAEAIAEDYLKQIAEPGYGIQESCPATYVDIVWRINDITE